jgi:RNA-directed DNA polymerase
MEKRVCTMIRFMDNFIVLTKIHHPLRRAIKDVYTVLKTLGLHIAKGKTSIGPIARGFDFLGVHFSHNEPGVAKKSVSRMREKVLRLYERGACAARIEGTLTHWMRWLKAGLKGRIESALKPLLLTTHSIQQKIKIARHNRLSVDQVATLIHA